MLEILEPIKLTKIDFQLFAEEDDIDILVGDDDLYDNDDYQDDDDTEDDFEDDEEIDDQDDDENQKENQSVPLAKYMAEKKKRQEMEKILSKQESEKQRFDMVQDLILRGWPEHEAQQLAAERIQQSQVVASVKAKQMDLDIRDLAKSEEFFSDALSYKDEIREKMEELDIDAETAYMMLRGKIRTKEMQTKQEQRNLARRQKGAKKVENSTASAPKSQFKLDDDDKKALKELQRVQPDAGWTVEKYYKIMKS